MTSSTVTTIPRFLLPTLTIHSSGTFIPRAIGPKLRGPATRISAHHNGSIIYILSRTRRSLSSSSSLLASSRSSAAPNAKQRVLEKPDKFRPPSHPQRVVLRPRRGGNVSDPGAPYNYPGPPLSEKEKQERKTRRYPNAFPPEGTLLHKFLTARWIHVWISMSVLVSIATFTFTTNFKETSPFGHLLPPWSGLLTHPISTISQALSVYRMHVEHTSKLAREKRHQRIDDAEKRRRYRIAHGLEKPDSEGLSLSNTKASDSDDSSSTTGNNHQSPTTMEEHADIQGRRKPVKMWLGIW